MKYLQMLQNQLNIHKVKIKKIYLDKQHRKYEP